MEISVSATNPCHLYPMAIELHRAGVLHTYYSGYPRWKLPGSGSLPCRSHSSRTLVTYSLLRLPPRLRPAPRDLFLWQDRAFDAWVGRTLEPCDSVHAMPGQCLRTFEKAQTLGVPTVLNHATGPARHWVKVMRPEYERVGLKVAEVTHYDEAYFEREEQEYEMADYHCAASSVVRDQLVESGIEEERIWIVPYGADPAIFHSDGAKREGGFRVIFAGQVGLRKGIRALLDALQAGGARDWKVDLYGPVLPEAEKDIAAYRGKPQLTFHGAVSGARLADAFRKGSVLILPSLEEGFGLVVAQALACGLPCVVSDQVGAKDLIRQRQNGSVFALNNTEKMAAELRWWSRNPAIVEGDYTWTEPARKLIHLSRDVALPA